MLWELLPQHAAWSCLHSVLIASEQALTQQRSQPLFISVFKFSDTQTATMPKRTLMKIQGVGKKIIDEMELFMLEKESSNLMKGGRGNPTCNI